MSETEAAAFADAGVAGVFDATSRSAFVACTAGARTVFFCGSAFLSGAFALETADFRATAGFACLCAAGLRVAVLLVVLVGIVKSLFHGSCILSRASLLWFFFLRFLLSRNGVMNFLRLRFVHGQNVHEILHIRIA
jgi:hypothetical protein